MTALCHVCDSAVTDRPAHLSPRHVTLHTGPQRRPVRRRYMTLSACGGIATSSAVKAAAQIQGPLHRQVGSAPWYRPQSGHQVRGRTPEFGQRLLKRLPEQLTVFCCSFE